MEKKRKPVSTKLERALFEEAGWRCAVPTCRLENVGALEMAHIVPVEKGGRNDFNNMIVLCRNCHSRFDREKEKTMDRPSMKRLKRNLSIINGRYSHFEFRVLEYFSENLDKNFILLWGRELDVLFLVKDGLLEQSSRQFQNAINFPPAEFVLTPKGKEFIQRWHSIDSLDPAQKARE